MGPGRDVIAFEYAAMKIADIGVAIEAEGLAHSRRPWHITTISPISWRSWARNIRRVVGLRRLPALTRGGEACGRNLRTPEKMPHRWRGALIRGKLLRPASVEWRNAVLT